MVKHNFLRNFVIVRNQADKILEKKKTLIGSYHFFLLQHNMSTAVDKDAIRRAYDDVRSDTSDTEW